MKREDISQVASILDRIVQDRATRVETVGKAAVVLALTPEWARAAELRALYGLPKETLRGMVMAGKICAKKCDPTLRYSATLYRVSDVREAIEELPDYREWMREEERKAKREAKVKARKEAAK